MLPRIHDSLKPETLPELSQRPLCTSLTNTQGSVIGQYFTFDPENLLNIVKEDPTETDNTTYTVNAIDNIRIHSAAFRHEAAVGCLAAYLLLQNYFGIRDFTSTALHFFGGACETYAEPVSYGLSAILLPGTAVAVLLSKALKIIEVPRKIALWTQETALREIEEQLKPREVLKQLNKKNKLVIVFSKEEFEKEIEPKAEATYGFYYTLHILAKRYNTSLSLLVHTEKNTDLHEEVIPNLLLKLSPDESTSNDIDILLYSTKYCLKTTLESTTTLSTINSDSIGSPLHTSDSLDIDDIEAAVKPRSFNIMPQAFNTRRYLLDRTNYLFCQPSYYEIKAEASAVIFDVSFFTFSSIFLGLLPVLVSVLQGGGTLAAAGNVDEDSPWSTQLEITLVGALIGLIRGWVTYKQKADDAEARFRAWLLSFSGFLGACASFASDWLNSRNKISILCIGLLSLIHELKSMVPNSFDECWMRFKQAMCIAFGLYAALGTVVFYAGLGFFFSSSGLLSTINLLNQPTPTQTILLAISATFCLAQVLLNAIGNQGPDVIWRYWLRAIGLSKEPNEKPRDWTQRMLSLMVKFDAINTGCSAATGSLKMMDVLCPSASDAVRIPVSISIFIAVALSQNTFAWTSAKKDHHLWKDLYQLRYASLFNTSNKTLGCCFFKNKQEDNLLPNPIESTNSDTLQKLFIPSGQAPV